MSAGRLRRRLADRRIALVLRLAAGALLIYASLDGLLDPQPLADAIDDYRVLPFALVNFVALVLPWVELATGACLIFGLGTPGAGLVTAALAAIYTGVIAAALLRGLQIGCGCFDDETGTLLSWSDLWLRLTLLVAGMQITMAARFLEWPLGSLLTRARQGRHAMGPTLGP